MKKRFKVALAMFVLISFPAFSQPVLAEGNAAGKEIEQIKQEEKEKIKKKEKAKKILEIEDVVVTATKMGKKQSQITEAVTVIDEQAIKESGITDTTDILRYTPAVQFKRGGGPGQYVYTKLRGYGDGNFVVLIDGMKINESMSAGTGNFFSKFDPYLIERTEVLRGPQSVLYGADTTAGVFSFTTKGGLPETAMNVNAEYGTFDWKKGAAGVRGTEGNFRYAVNVIGVDSGGVQRYEDFSNLSPQIKLGWGKKDLFDAEISFIDIHSKWNYAMLIEPYNVLTSRDQLWSFQVPDPSRYNIEDYTITALNLKHQISDEFRHKLMLGWFKKKTESNNPNDGLLGYITAPTDNFTVNYVNYYSQGQAVPVYDDGDNKPYFYENQNYQADYNIVWDKKTSWFKNTALVGLNWIEQKGSKWGKYGNADGSQRTGGIYANDQVLLADDALVLDVGIRFDKNSAFEDKATWKVGISYTVKPIQTTFFSNYGTSFRQPTITNLYDPQYGNPDLQPESGWTVQGGARQKILDGKIQLEAVAWHSNLNNVIAFEYITSNTGHYVNRDEQTTQGIEFDFQWYFLKDFTLLGNYTYTESETEQQGVSYRTVQIARNAGNAGLEYHLDNDLFLGIYGYYQGPRLRWKGDVEGDGYLRCDLTGRYQLRKGLNIYTRINNLFNVKYTEDAYEAPGFNIIAGLSWDVNFRQ